MKAFLKGCWEGLSTLLIAMLGVLGFCGLMALTYYTLTINPWFTLLQFAFMFIIGAGIVSWYEDKLNRESFQKIVKENIERKKKLGL